MTTHDEVREAAEKWALCEHEGVDAQYCLCHVKDEVSFIEGAEWKEQMMKLDSMPMRKYAEEIDSLKSQLQASKQENARLIGLLKSCYGFVDAYDNVGLLLEELREALREMGES